MAEGEHTIILPAGDGGAGEASSYNVLPPLEDTFLEFMRKASYHQNSESTFESLLEIRKKSLQLRVETEERARSTRSLAIKRYSLGILLRKTVTFMVQGLGLPLLGLMAVMRLLSVVVPPAMQTVGMGPDWFDDKEKQTKKGENM